MMNATNDASLVSERQATPCRFDCRLAGKLRRMRLGRCVRIFQRRFTRLVGIVSLADLHSWRVV